MNKKKKFSIALFILFALAIIIFVTIVGHKTDLANLPALQPATPLTTAEVKNLNTKLGDLVTEKDPSVALEELKNETISNASILKSCHILTHQIGRDAFEKYNDFGLAMKYYDDFCNSGYIHGVIEGYFKQSPDAFKNIRTICKDYGDDTLIGWECSHGIGHGVMYFSENDLTLSLKSCEQLTTSAAVDSCYNGVFMENFNTEQKDHFSKFLDENNPFYPCNTLEIKYKSDCYLYAPTYYLYLHQGQYKDVLNWCSNAENNYIQSCIHGASSQMIKENLNDIKSVESLCNTTGYDLECIEGVSGLLVNHYGSSSKVKDICSTLNSVDQITCNDVVNGMKSKFKDI